MPTDQDDVDNQSLNMERIPDDDIELGYFFNPSAWGHGYATEVCNRLLQFVVEETSLGEIIAAVHENNAASRKVLEKSGLLHSSQALCWGKSSPIYKITRSDWAALDRHPGAKSG